MTHAVWPPAPVLPPLLIIMLPQVEREANQAAAIEAEKMSCKISDERALVEQARHDCDREARKQEAHDAEHDCGHHHRRAETESSRWYQ